MPGETNALRAHRDKNASTVVRTVGEKIWLCNSRDLVLIDLLGGLNTAPSKFQIGLSEIGCEYEWIEDYNIPHGDTITMPVLDPACEGLDCYGHNVNGTADISVANPQRFFRGMVLYVNSPIARLDPQEYLWVVDTDPAAGTITVIRGWRNTPTYAYDAGTELCILTIVAEECHEHVINYNPARQTYKNYTQTFVGGLSESKKHKRIRRHGTGGESEYDRQMRRVMGGNVSGRSITGELPFAIEMAGFYGLPHPGGPDGDSSFGGINSFDIMQIIEASLSYELIVEIASQINLNGGDVDETVIVVGNHFLQQFSTWADPYVRTARTEMTVGTTVNSIQTPYGTMGIRHHRHLRNNEIYFLDPIKMGYFEIREFEEERLGKTTSLCEDTMIDGEYGFALACACHHARLRIDSECIPPDDCDVDCGEEPETEEKCYPGVAVPGTEGDCNEFETPSADDCPPDDPADPADPADPVIAP